MSNFGAWWGLCQLPQFDGTFNDGAGTHWGVTFPWFQSAQAWIGNSDQSAAAFAKLTQAQAATLAQAYAWNRVGGRLLASGNDVSLVDWAWTSGGAVPEIQEQLGVTPDGIVGPETLRAIAGRPTFIADCHAWRVAYYNMLGFQTSEPGLYGRATATMILAERLASQ